MSKIQKIKQAMEKTSDNDATKAIKYLLWYIESQDRQISEQREAYNYIAHPGDTELNFSNWISAHREMVDQGQESRDDYERWFTNAAENNKYIIVAGKKELRRKPKKLIP